MGRSHHAATIASAALTVVTTASTFGPWARSGTRVRSSYDVVDVADRAGVVPAALASVTWVWFLVPVLCGGVLVAIGLGRVRMAALGAATLGALVTTGAVLVARSPLVTEPGAILGATAGGLTFMAGAAVQVTASTTGRTR